MWLPSKTLVGIALAYLDSKAAVSHTHILAFFCWQRIELCLSHFGSSQRRTCLGQPPAAESGWGYLLNCQQYALRFGTLAVTHVYSAIGQKALLAKL